jgi:hypothetical protein
MHYVTDASYLNGHRLVVCFETGERRVVDFSSHLDGPDFEPLKDVSYFQQFRVDPDIDTVVWPNHAEFSPDFLYEVGQAIIEPRLPVMSLKPSPR